MVQRREGQRQQKWSVQPADVTERLQQEERHELVLWQQKKRYWHQSVNRSMERLAKVATLKGQLKQRGPAETNVQQ